jgi:hypothetical protein
MKPKTLRRTVEKATDRALRHLLEAHPEAIAPEWRKSAEKRLVGFLCDELMRAMGHGNQSTKGRP